MSAESCTALLDHRHIWSTHFGNTRSGRSRRGVIAAGGLLIWTLGWHWADPAVSVLIGVLVIYSSWGLLKQSVAVLMEGAPGNVDVDAVRNALAGVPGVTAVHDLHVWSITSGMIALSGHICVAEAVSSNAVLATVCKRVREEFGIDHITIQVEPEGFAESTVHA